MKEHKTYVETMQDYAKSIILTIDIDVDEIEFLKRRLAYLEENLKIHESQLEYVNDTIESYKRL